VARALANGPRLLLADEPTGNLDSRTAREIVGLLAGLNRDGGLTVVMVSHEEPLVRSVAHGIVRLQDGRVAAVEGEI
jgi:putative ABC transport system ATP-binding protein